MNGDPRTDDGNGSTLTTMGHFATTENIASTSTPTFHGSSENTITSSTLSYTGNLWHSQPVRSTCPRGPKSHLHRLGPREEQQHLLVPGWNGYQQHRGLAQLPR